MVIQSGEYDRANVTQRGSASTSTIDQDTSGGIANASVANVTQTGMGHLSEIIQRGTGAHRANVTQTGMGQISNINQTGMGNISNITQGN